MWTDKPLLGCVISISIPKAIHYSSGLMSAYHINPIVNFSQFLQALNFLYKGLVIAVMHFYWLKMKRSNFFSIYYHFVPMISLVSQLDSLIQVWKWQWIIIFHIFLAMHYKVLVVGEGKYFGVCTASAYVNIGGENGESGSIVIPKGEYHTEFSVSNLQYYMLAVFSLELSCLFISFDSCNVTHWF